MANITLGTLRDYWKRVYDAITGPPGSTAPTYAMQVGGTDGANLRALKTDADGHQQVDVLSLPGVDVTDRAARVVGVVTAADGGIASIGAKADTAVTDPTLSASEIALLKGLLKQLQGTGPVVTPVSLNGSIPAGTNVIGSVDLRKAPQVGFGTAMFDVASAVGSLPSQPTPATPRIYDMAAFGEKVYAIVSNRWILESNDEGITWSIYDPYTAFQYGGEQVYWQPWGIAVDCVGLETPGTLGAVYMFGRATRLNPTRYNVSVLYKAPGSSTWVMRLDPNREWTNYFYGFSVGKIGMAAAHRDDALGVNQLVYSTDYGSTWSVYNFDPDTEFANHPHDVWCNPFEAEAYVTGGDSYDGLGGALRTVDFLTYTRILPEVPGFRLVPVWGGPGYQVYGAESSAGAVALLSRKDANGNFWHEVVLGKTGYDFMNFRSLKTSEDGFLVGGTYADMAGEGGSLYVSNDLGATFAKLKLPMGAVGALAITPNRVVVGCAHHYNNTYWYPFIMSLSKRYLNSLPRERKVVKPVRLADLTATDVQCNLAAGATTYVANMRAYKNVKAIMQAATAGTVAIEGSRYAPTPHAKHPVIWDELASKEFATAGTETVDLSAFNEYGWFRVKNKGASAISIRQALFIGELAG